MQYTRLLFISVPVEHLEKEMWRSIYNFSIKYPMDIFVVHWKAGSVHFEKREIENINDVDLTVLLD